VAELVVVEAGAGGLPRARVSGARADAELYLQGGHLTQWQPHGAAPVLFLSPRATYAPGKAIRGGVPLIEVEAEGLPLSLVRAAEAVARGAAEPTTPDPVDDDLAGSLFLAEAALTATGAPRPVPQDAAERLVEELLAHGLEPDEVLAVLPHLPLQPDTADTVTAIIRAAGIG